LEFAVEVEVEGAEADDDTEGGLAFEDADERDGDVLNGEGVFAGLEADVGDALGSAMDEELGEVVDGGAVALEVSIRAAHAAITAILAAEVGDFDHAAYEDLLAEAGEGGRSGGFVEGGLVGAAQPEDVMIWDESVVQHRGK
jgi:hypothetical protein